VPYNHPNATHRYYYNLEGLHIECINIEDQKVFEETHKVLYIDNFYKLQQDFILTSVKES